MEDDGGGGKGRGFLDEELEAEVEGLEVGC